MRDIVPSFGRPLCLVAMCLALLLPSFRCELTSGGICESGVDLTETLWQLTSSEANEVAERLDVRFRSETECIGGIESLMRILKGFDMVMIDNQVPRFRNMAKTLGRALALRGRLDDAATVYNASFFIERGLHRSFAAFDYSFFGDVSIGKLIHDVEQHAYLMQIGVELPPGIVAAYSNTLESLWNYVDVEMQGKDDVEKLTAHLKVTQGGFSQIQPFFNRALHQPDLPPIYDYLNRDVLKFRQADARYRLSKHGIVVIDEVLDSRAVKMLHEYMMRSASFFQKEKNHYSLKADVSDALAHKMAGELRQRLPQMLQKYPLQKAWSYKVNNNAPRQRGLGVHADEASVNCNIWLTPSDANLDAASGGLVIYEAHAWGDSRFNDWWDDVRDDAYKYQKLKAIGFKNVTVAYRSNRAICFRSSLYHGTDRVHFKGGFRNRRIGITLLFGESFK